MKGRGWKGKGGKLRKGKGGKGRKGRGKGGEKRKGNLTFKYLLRPMIDTDVNVAVL